MNLKTSFKHQNKLAKAISDLSSYLSYSANVSEIVATHKRAKSVSTKEDETITREKTSNFTTDQILEALFFLIEEKNKLTSKINLAKKALDIDVDGMMSMNIVKRDALRPLKVMCNMKEKTTLATGRDYTFNLEGNQIQYVYEIEEVSKPDFDQTKLKDFVKEMEDELERSSDTIEKIFLETEVDYVQIIGNNDSSDEIIKCVLDIINK